MSRRAPTPNPPLILSPPLTAIPPAGITRLQRWERARALGLSPPATIRDALLEHRDDPAVTYRCGTGTMRDGNGAAGRGGGLTVLCARSLWHEYGL